MNGSEYLRWLDQRVHTSCGLLPKVNQQCVHEIELSFCLLCPLPADTENVAIVRAILQMAHSLGIKVPLCADIHFSPRAAMEAALHVEKVRINPGNFSGRPGRESKRISEREYEEGRERAREAFRPLVQLLKSEGRALRIRLGTALDVVVESDVNILDIAALAVIVREAGAVFTELDGGPLTLDTRTVLAAVPALHDELRLRLA